MANVLLNFKKLPSDSSASITVQSPSPRVALVFKELIMPPLIIVGLKFASFKIVETNEVMVVFPCDPEITIFFFKEIM